MSEPADITPTPDDPVDRIVLEYIQAAEAGRPLDQHELLARYPEFAVELADFFASQEQFENVASPFRFAAVAVGEGNRSGSDQSSAHTAHPGNSSTEQANSPGSRVRYFGEYELIEEIARGGMGVVFKARQVRLNRIVALKMILAGQFASAEDVKRFQVEAENAARLDHPNIVPVYEVGRHKGQHYFTMKLVEGGSLAGKAANYSKDLKAAAVLLETVCRAVHYGHQRGILHRDIKPGNILLDGNGLPHVTDFGLARRLEDEPGLTLSGALLGSPRYMSPEQARSEKALTVATDVWGIGAVLYELLTGRPPFAGDTTFAILEQVKNTDPPRPSAVSPKIERDLEVICLKCLQKDPHRRYASAEAMAEDLERWLRGEPIAARPAGAHERLWRWCHRNPVPAALALVSVLAALLIVAIAVALPYQDRLRGAIARSERSRKAEEVQRKNAERASLEMDRAQQGEKVQRRFAEDALSNLRRFDYLTHIAWAEREWVSGNPTRAEQILEECPPDLRRWEWYHLESLWHTEVSSIATEHRLCGVVTGFGGGIVTIGADGRVRCYGDELRKSNIQAQLKTLEHVTAAAVSPDGLKLAVGYRSGGIDIIVLGWHAEKTTVRRAVDEELPVVFLAFGPGGAKVAAGIGRSVNVYDVATGAELLNLAGHRARVNALAFSPNHATLASCSGEPTEYAASGHVSIRERPGEIIVWNLEKGAAQATFAEKGVISAIVFMPDGRIASAHDDGTVRLWHSSGRADLTLSGHVGPVSALAVGLGNGPEAVLASGGQDRTIRVWDSHSGKQTLVCRSHQGKVAGVAFLAGTSSLVSVSDDQSMKIWDQTAPASGTDARTTAIPNASPTAIIHGSDVAFSPDGQLAALIGNGAMTLQDVKTGRDLWRGLFDGRRVAFAPDGSWLAVSGGDGHPYIIETATGKELRTFPNSIVRPGYHYGVAISPDGKYLTESGTVWEVATGHAVQTLNEKGLENIYDSAFSPDGRLLASAGGKFTMSTVGCPGQVKLWDWRAGSVVRSLEGQRFTAYAVAFSPDGSRVAYGGGLYHGPQIKNEKYRGATGEVKVWDVATGQEIFTWERPECVFRVAFSPDGSRLASAGGEIKGRDPCPITLWDLAAGREVIQLNGHASSVYGLAFSADGRLFASIDDHAIARYWRPTGVMPGFGESLKLTMRPTTVSTDVAATTIPTTFPTTFPYQAK